MQLLTLIKIAHLVGLIMGLGGALLLDLTILTRGIIKPVSHYTIHQLHMLSRVVAAGLLLLWITGLALIWINWQIKPEYIENPKLWAKIIIVCILTVNGILIHTAVMPKLEERLGLRLFEGRSNRHVMMFTFVASVSAVSWITPFILGKASELNFVVPASTILIAYASAVAFAWGGMLLLTSGIVSIQADVRQEYERPRAGVSTRFAASNFLEEQHDPVPGGLLVVEHSSVGHPRIVPKPVASSWTSTPEVVAMRAELRSVQRRHAA
jgi:hypothetical protein